MYAAIRLYSHPLHAPHKEGPDCGSDRWGIAGHILCYCWLRALYCALHLIKVEVAPWMGTITLPVQLLAQRYNAVGPHHCKHRSVLPATNMAKPAHGMTALPCKRHCLCSLLPVRQRHYTSSPANRTTEWSLHRLDLELLLSLCRSPSQSPDSHSTAAISAGASGSPFGASVGQPLAELPGCRGASPCASAVLLRLAFLICWWPSPSLELGWLLAGLLRGYALPGCAAVLCCLERSCSPGCGADPPWAGAGANLA